MFQHFTTLHTIVGMSKSSSTLKHAKLLQHSKFQTLNLQYDRSYSTHKKAHFVSHSISTHTKTISCRCWTWSLKNTHTTLTSHEKLHFHQNKECNTIYTTSKRENDTFTSKYDTSNQKWKNCTRIKHHQYNIYWQHKAKRLNNWQNFVLKTIELTQILDSRFRVSKFLIHTS